MTMLYFRLFGKFSVQYGDQKILESEGQNVQSLLGYLLLHRNQPHLRDKLADLFWGNKTTASSKKYLRQTIWQLKSSLNIASTKDILLVESNWVQINPKIEYWLDVAELENAFAMVSGIPGRMLKRDLVEKITQAGNLYKGELLEGWYQDWCLLERERLHNIYLDLLDKNLGFCEVHKEYEAGLKYGMRMLRFDNARERTHRRLMRIYYLSGSRTAALRQYEECVKKLHDELGVSPAKSTKTLYEHIKEDQFEKVEYLYSDMRMKDTSPISSLDKTLCQLNQIQWTLGDAQKKIREEIQNVKRAIKEIKN